MLCFSYEFQSNKEYRLEKVATLAQSKELNIVLIRLY